METRCPAASVAVAVNWCVASSVTDAVSPAAAKVAAAPCTSIPPLQSLDWNTFTVEPASAEPLTSGLFSSAGESGSVSVIDGAAGACESSVYANAPEHGEALPAASVAVARRFVVWLSGTVAVMPPEPLKAALEPAPSSAPEQLASPYRRTVEPDSAPDPLTDGVLAFAGESGSVSEIVGAPGACESSV